jgi:hypothetical protein
MRPAILLGRLDAKTVGYASVRWPRHYKRATALFGNQTLEFAAGFGPSAILMRRSSVSPSSRTEVGRTSGSQRSCSVRFGTPGQADRRRQKRSIVRALLRATAEPAIGVKRIQLPSADLACCLRRRVRQLERILPGSPATPRRTRPGTGTRARVGMGWAPTGAH